MKTNFTSRWLILLLISGTACAQQDKVDEVSSDGNPIYQFREPSSPDGTGKYYMGRDIAQVMGHRGAGWLERPGREEEEGTDLLIEALDLRAEDVVADIGAGSGYFTFKLSKEVPQGEVLAVDIQDEMLKIIRQRMKQQEVENIELVLGEVDQPNLPEDSVDLVLMVDAYHEFSHPREMMQGIVDALAPGGRVVLAEYRAEDPSIMIKPLHKMSEEQVVKEMRAVGLELIENRGLLPQQHLLFFRKAQ
ncbi:MAG: class I SAM-dependent methyltransferase [Cyclobacteriaceae bacterium]